MNLSVTIFSPLNTRQCFQTCEKNNFENVVRIMPSRSVLALSWRQHAPARCNMHTYMCTTTVINRGTVCICFQKLGPQNMQDAMHFAMQFFVWFWLAALHGTSTNRMCYLSYQRACHYNAYPAQNGWQSLEQDTNTKLNMFTNGTTFIKVKLRLIMVAFLQDLRWFVLNQIVDKLHHTHISSNLIQI